MAVPYTFQTATGSLPLSQLDSNFSTAITIGNTAVVLGDTITTINNLTLANVAITSVSTAFPNGYLANSNVIVGTTTLTLGSTVTSINGLSLSNVTISSGNVTISNVTTTNVTATTANVTTANIGTLVVIGDATVGGNTTVTGNITAAKGTFTSANVTGTANVQVIAVTQNATVAGNVTVTGNVSMNVATITTANVSGTSNISTLVVTGTSTLVGAATVQGLTVGKGAGAVSTNTTVGNSALAGGSQTGTNLTAFGFGTLNVNSSGNYNTAIGASALQNNSTASNNTAVGYQAGFNNSTGSNNSAFGLQALVNNTTASNNTAVGYQAGYTQTTAAQNAFFGYQAGYGVTTGSKNVILGSYQGSAAPISATGSNYIVLSDGDGNVRQTIDSSGNVGIGTSSPSQKLEVAGNVLLSNNQYLGVKDTTGAAVGFPILTGSNDAIFGYLASGTTGISTYQFRSGNNVERMRIDSSGNAYIETGLLWQYAPTPTTKAAAATLTAAELATDIITLTGTTYTITLPTGTALDTYYTGVPAVNIGYDFHIVNTASGIITIAVGASGMTSVGLLTVAATVSAHFRLRRTAANTYILYRLS